MATDISFIRNEYSKEQLSEEHVEDNPLKQFESWFDQAIEAQVREPNAMTLATCTNNIPDARIVLLKGITTKGLQFYTNYDSAKGKQLKENPHASLVFFWAELERQVRVQGVVEKTTPKESDDYFYTRPEASQIGACASPQSSVIESREILENRFKALKEMGKIERPLNWGGYTFIPYAFEFWQGRRSRLHDRVRFSKKDGVWTKERLAP